MGHTYNYFYIGDSLLSESDFGKAPPRLLTFSKVESDIKERMSPHLHSHLEIFYFENGHGFFVCGDRAIPIKAHDLIVANANSIHMQYSSTENDRLLYYNFAVDRVQTVGNPPNCITGHEFEHHSFGVPDNPFYSGIRDILAECTEKQYCYYSRINALFTDLLIRTVRLFREDTAPKEATPRKNTETISAVKSYIDTHYAENLNLDSLTRLSFMQKSYFLHSFKKAFGISPMKYLNSVRMEHAKLLLLRSDASVTEISREVGFSNPTYFSEMFLKSVGVSPTEYRKIATQSS